MQKETDDARADAANAREWLQWLIDIARAGDERTLAAAVDGADEWLHQEEAAEEAALGLAGSGAEVGLKEARNANKRIH